VQKSIKNVNIIALVFNREFVKILSVFVDLDLKESIVKEKVDVRINVKSEEFAIRAFVYVIMDIKEEIAQNQGIKNFLKK
jgi:hypothetical protein